MPKFGSCQGMDEGPFGEDLAITVLTCEGDLRDPRFPRLLDKLVCKLRRLVSDDKEPFQVTKVEPWNSVRVTFNIPRDAALRLRQLAERGDTTLRELGILSVQVEGDQVITLTLANSFNESQTLLLGKTTETLASNVSVVSAGCGPLSSSNLRRNNAAVGSLSSTAFELNPNPGPCGSSVVKDVKGSVGHFQGIAGGSVSKDVTSSTCTSVSVVCGEGNSDRAEEPFKSPNVVAPTSGEPLPFLASNSGSLLSPSGGGFPVAGVSAGVTASVMGCRAKGVMAGNRSQQPSVAPFPFTSMQNAMHTKQGTNALVSPVNSTLNCSVRLPFQGNLGLSLNRPSSATSPSTVSSQTSTGMPSVPCHQPSAPSPAPSPFPSASLSPAPSSSCSSPAFIRNPTIFNNVRVTSSVTASSSSTSSHTNQAQTMALAAVAAAAAAATRSVTCLTPNTPPLISASSNVALTSPLLVNLLQSDATVSGTHLKLMPPPPPPAVSAAPGSLTLPNEPGLKRNKPRKSRKSKDKNVSEELDAALSRLTPTATGAFGLISSTSKTHSQPQPQPQPQPHPHPNFALQPSNALSESDANALTNQFPKSQNSVGLHSHLLNIPGAAIPRYPTLHPDAQGQPQVVHPSGHPSLRQPQPQTTGVVGSPPVAVPHHMQRPPLLVSPTPHFHPQHPKQPHLQQHQQQESQQLQPSNKGVEAEATVEEHPKPEHVESLELRSSLSESVKLSSVSSPLAVNSCVIIPQPQAQPQQKFDPIFPSPPARECSGKTKHLINPFTGHLEPMVSDDEEEDRTSPASLTHMSELEPCSASENGHQLSDISSKDKDHNSDTDSGLGKSATDVSSQSSIEISEGTVACNELRTELVTVSNPREPVKPCAVPSEVSLTAEKLKVRLKVGSKAQSAVLGLNEPSTSPTKSQPSEVSLRKLSTCSAPHSLESLVSEPKVPPLHISLRGPHSAVVVSGNPENSSTCPRRPRALRTGRAMSAESAFAEEGKSHSQKKKIQREQRFLSGGGIVTSQVSSCTSSSPVVQVVRPVLTFSDTLTSTPPPVEPSSVVNNVVSSPPVISAPPPAPSPLPMSSTRTIDNPTTFTTTVATAVTPLICRSADIAFDRSPDSAQQVKSCESNISLKPNVPQTSDPICSSETPPSSAIDSDSRPLDHVYRTVQLNSYNHSTAAGDERVTPRNCVDDNEDENEETNDRNCVGPQEDSPERGPGLEPNENNVPNSDANHTNHSNSHAMDEDKISNHNHVDNCVDKSRSSLEHEANTSSKELLVNERHSDKEEHQLQVTRVTEVVTINPVASVSLFDPLVAVSEASCDSKEIPPLIASNCLIYPLQSQSVIVRKEAHEDQEDLDYDEDPDEEEREGDRNREQDRRAKLLESVSFSVASNALEAITSIVPAKEEVTLESVDGTPSSLKPTFTLTSNEVRISVGDTSDHPSTEESSLDSLNAPTENASFSENSNSLTQDEVYKKIVGPDAGQVDPGLLVNIEPSIGSSQGVAVDLNHCPETERRANSLAACHSDEENPKDRFEEEKRPCLLKESEKDEIFRRQAAVEKEVLVVQTFESNAIDMNVVKEGGATEEMKRDGTERREQMLEEFEGSKTSDERTQSVEVCNRIPVAAEVGPTATILSPISEEKLKPLQIIITPAVPSPSSVSSSTATTSATQAKQSPIESGGSFTNNYILKPNLTSPSTSSSGNSGVGASDKCLSPSGCTVPIKLLTIGPPNCTGISVRSTSSRFAQLISSSAPVSPISPNAGVNCASSAVQNSNSSSPPVRLLVSKVAATSSVTNSGVVPVSGGSSHVNLVPLVVKSVVVTNPSSSLKIVSSSRASPTFNVTNSLLIPAPHPFFEADSAPVNLFPSNLQKETPETPETGVDATAGGDQEGKQVCSDEELNNSVLSDEGSDHPINALEILEIPQLEPVDLTVHCQEDSGSICEDLLMPNITTDNAYESAEVDGEEDVEDSGDEQGYSVASGDHNYICVKTSLLNDADEAEDLTLNLATVNNDHPSGENSCLKSELQTTGSEQPVHNAVELNSRPSKRKSSENAAELIKACMGLDDGPKRSSFAPNNSSAGQHVSSLAIKSQSQPSSRSRSSSFEHDLVSDLSSQEVPVVVKTPKNCKMRKSKVVEPVNHSAVVPEKEEMPFAFDDELQVEEDIPNKPWNSKSRLRQTKQDGLPLSPAPGGTPSQSRATPSKKRVNSKEGKTKEPNASGKRASERKRKPRDKSNATGARPTRRAKEQTLLPSTDLFLVNEVPVIETDSTAREITVNIEDGLNSVSVNRVNDVISTASSATSQPVAVSLLNNNTTNSSTNNKRKTRGTSIINDLHESSVSSTKRRRIPKDSHSHR